MSDDEIVALSKRNHKSGLCAGFMDVTDDPPPASLNTLTWITPLSFSTRPLVQAYYLEPIFSEISPVRLLDFIRSLSAYPSRYYKTEGGVAAAQWIFKKFAELSRSRTDVTVEYFIHPFQQSSVVARIQGQGPEAAERIILGGHEDSTNTTAGVPILWAKAPGADDNASGIAVLLETFRILVDSGFRPNRTIEFIAYAAEEAGLRGSQGVAQDYRLKGIPVAAVLQLDMTMFPGKIPAMGIITDNVDMELTAFMKRLVETYIKMPWTESACGYGCSDHASWTRSGFPSAFPFEGTVGALNPNLHSNGDTVETLDAAFGSHFVKLALSFAAELAEGI